MKNIIKGILGGLLVCVFVFILASETFAVKPESAQGPHEHVTGHLTAVVGGTTLWLDFNAHDTDPQKGHVVYGNSSGGYFEGKVDCYKKYDDQVVFAGVIESGSYSQPEFKVSIKIDDPKKVRVPVGTNLDCTRESSFPATVTVDNYVLHEVPDNAPQLDSEILVLGASENATPSEKAVDNKWDLSGTFISSRSWGVLIPSGSAWSYDVHIKQAIQDDSSVGVVKFSSGDVIVVGQVKAVKEDYKYWDYDGDPYDTADNLAAVGTTFYDGQLYNFMFLYSEGAIWLALSDYPYTTEWDTDTVWTATQRAYDLLSQIIEDEYPFDVKAIH